MPFETFPLTEIPFPSAARTATPTVIPTFTGRGTGVKVRIKSTAASATPSVVFTIEGWDPAVGEWFTLLASAAVVNGSTTIVMTLFPGATVTANVSANDFLPEKWRVVPTHADSDSITYTVACFILP